MLVEFPSETWKVLHAVSQLREHLKELNRQANELEAEIQAWPRQSKASQRLTAIPGIGLIIATALVASVGDTYQFENGRPLAAERAALAEGLHELRGHELDFMTVIGQLPCLGV